MRALLRVATLALREFERVLASRLPLTEPTRTAAISYLTQSHAHPISTEPDRQLFRRGDGSSHPAGTMSSQDWSHLTWKELAEASDSQARGRSRSPSPTLSGWSDLVASARAPSSHGNPAGVDHGEVSSMTLSQGQQSPSAPRKRRKSTADNDAIRVDKHGYPILGKKTGPKPGTPR